MPPRKQQKTAPAEESQELGRESLTVKLTAQEKQQLARAVMLRKLGDPSIPVRWGLSDYVREVLIEHLSSLKEG